MTVEIGPTSFDMINIITAVSAKSEPASMFAEVVMLGSNVSLLPLSMAFGFTGDEDTVLGKMKPLIPPFAGIGVLIGIPILMVPKGLAIGVELRLGTSSSARRQRH